MDMLDKGIIQVLGGTEWDSARFHHATQKVCNVKHTNCVFMEFFYVIVLEYGWQQVTESAESKTSDSRGITYTQNMDESHKCYVKQWESDTKEYIVSDSIYMTFKTGKPIDGDRR